MAGGAGPGGVGGPASSARDLALRTLTSEMRPLQRAPPRLGRGRPGVRRAPAPPPPRARQPCTARPDGPPRTARSLARHAPRAHCAAPGPARPARSLARPRPCHTPGPSWPGERAGCTEACGSAVCLTRPARRRGVGTPQRRRARGGGLGAAAPGPPGPREARPHPHGRQHGSVRASGEGRGDGGALASPRRLGPTRWPNVEWGRGRGCGLGPHAGGAGRAGGEWASSRRLGAAGTCSRAWVRSGHAGPRCSQGRPPRDKQRLHSQRSQETLFFLRSRWARPAYLRTQIRKSSNVSSFLAEACCPSPPGWPHLLSAGAWGARASLSVLQDTLQKRRPVGGRGVTLLPVSLLWLPWTSPRNHYPRFCPPLLATEPPPTCPPSLCPWSIWHQTPAPTQSLSLTLPAAETPPPHTHIHPLQTLPCSQSPMNHKCQTLQVGCSFGAHLRDSSLLRACTGSSRTREGAMVQALPQTTRPRWGGRAFPDILGARDRQP